MNIVDSSIAAETLSAVNGASYLPPPATAEAAETRGALVASAVENALVKLLGVWYVEPGAVFLRRVPAGKSGLAVRASGWPDQGKFEPGEWGVLAKITGCSPECGKFLDRFSHAVLRLPLMVGELSTPAGSLLAIRRMTQIGELEFSDIVDPVWGGGIQGTVTIELRISQEKSSFASGEANDDSTAGESADWHAVDPGLVEAALQRWIAGRCNLQWSSRLDGYRTGFAFLLKSVAAPENTQLKCFHFELSGGAFSPEPFRRKLAEIVAALPSEPVEIGLPHGSSLRFSRIVLESELAFSSTRIWGRERFSGRGVILAEVLTGDSEIVVGDCPVTAEEPEEWPIFDFALIEEGLNEFAVELAGFEPVLELQRSAALIGQSSWGFRFRNFEFDGELRVVTLFFDYRFCEFDRSRALALLAKIEHCFPLYEQTFPLCGAEFKVAAILKERGTAAEIVDGDLPALSGSFGVALKIVL